MKKFIIGALILFAGKAWSADSVTIGAIQLVKPSTSSSSSLSWGAKNNSNYDVLAATISQMISSQGIATAQLEGWTLFKSTAENKLAALTLDTTTLLGKFGAIATDTTTILTRFSNVATDTTTLANRRVVIIGLSNNVRVGDLTAINFGTNLTLSVSGTTGTVDGAAGGGGGSVQNSTRTYSFGYNGSLNLSTATICGWLTACFSVGPDTVNVTGVWATAVEQSSVAATMFNLYVSTPGALSPLMASTTYFPTVIITTRTSSIQPQFSVSTGAVAGFPPLLLAPWSVVGVNMSTMPTSGDLSRGLRGAVTGWVAGR